MSSDTDTRWDLLTALISEEFRRNRLDPNVVFRADRSQLKLKACYDQRSPSPTWFTVTLSEEDLARDLDAMAFDFCETFRRDKERFALEQPP